MNVKIAHASIDERGKAKGGKAGDQTGKEVCIRDWYNKPWGYVIRFNDPKMREKVACAMERAAANNHIGYDQNSRNSSLYWSRLVGYDPGMITCDCETDCSALVTIACCYAGVQESKLVKEGNAATTRNLRSRLEKAADVTVFNSKDYTQSSDKLIRGDILLKEGSHVAVVTQGSNTTSKAQSTKTIGEVAREVICGKWGNGVERKTRLESAGYDYEEVRKEVNRIIHG